MSALSRRNFLALTGSAAAATLSGRLTISAGAAMGPADKFDLVIKGGDVLDPSQLLRGKRDIGIRWGTIEAIETEIPAARALKTIDAGGKLVTPGLIDLHCHVYPYGSAIGIPADELVERQCTTTVVSAGDAGVNNLAALRRYIVAQTRALEIGDEIFVEVVMTGHRVPLTAFLAAAPRAAGSACRHLPPPFRAPRRSGRRNRP